jgi:hypothetical protein
MDGKQRREGDGFSRPKMSAGVVVCTLPGGPF